MNRLPPELHLVHGTQAAHKGTMLPESVRARVPKAEWLDNPDAWNRDVFVKETSDLRVNTVDITLSGVEQSYVSLFLSQNYIDVPAKIYRAVLDDNDVVIGSPILVFNGVITNYDIQDSKSESTVTVQIASHWKDFEKENGRKTNDNSQKIYFPNDEGFEFAAKTIKDLKWGRK